MTNQTKTLKIKLVGDQEYTVRQYMRENKIATLEEGMFRLFEKGLQAYNDDLDDEGN